METGFTKCINDAQNRRDTAVVHRMRAEESIAKAVVDYCVSRNLLISVHDGEGISVSYSNSAETILKAMFTTDEDFLFVYTRSGDKKGWFQFVYGNDGWDVVSDSSANDFCEGVWNEVIHPLSDKIERGN